MHTLPSIKGWDWEFHAYTSTIKGWDLKFHAYTSTIKGWDWEFHAYTFINKSWGFGMLGTGFITICRLERPMHDNII